MLAYWSSLALVTLLMLASWSFALDEPFGLGWYVQDTNLFLSGAVSRLNPGQVTALQTDALGVSCVAFEVAYVVVLFRILSRLYVNEYSSLENLYDAIHLTTAIVVATAGSVALNKFGSPSTFFAVGAGLRPDFYLAGLGQAAFGALTGPNGPLSGFGSPRRPNIPDLDMTPVMPLEAIDGVDEDVAGRLRRIGITTCHCLAFSNPFVIWGRMSATTLSEVVDWIAQATLFTLLPTRIKELRAVQVWNVLDLLDGLIAKEAAIIVAAGISQSYADAYLKKLEAEPRLVKLRELNIALRQG